MTTAVLLSGGVDSSVALHLLRDQGVKDLRAYYLKVWLEEEVLSFAGDCPWEEDVQYARSTCERLDVPLEIIPLQTEYLERIVEHVLAELRAGRTPSPDVFCNRRIKFGAFLDRVGESVETVASGHYARTSTDDAGRAHLMRAPDPVKDQTYFLSQLTQQQLRKIRFPIGDLTKSEVRQLATDWELPARDRKDSQGICFLGKIDYRQFIEYHLGQRPGPIIDIDTESRLGEHRGYWFYTIGQRYGLGLSGGPWYVVAKQMEDNVLFVTHGEHRQKRSRSSFDARQPNWIAEVPKAGSFQLKLRHGPDLADCHMNIGDDGGLQIELDQPDSGVAPGQHAVIYSAEECLGGAVIC
jgi:tRNA (5-methylaminomethyl-2-thiouridylate)-methyltransferase